jgi:hypothetical protein
MILKASKMKLLIMRPTFGGEGRSVVGGTPEEGRVAILRHGLQNE